ncbi:MAG: hypothetical protein GWO24_30015, partial [Akkermansiaceae bacterium]|nr:hypothetical protein [Akkermansiaceae bacterium]
MEDVAGPAIAEAEEEALPDEAVLAAGVTVGEELADDEPVGDTPDEIPDWLRDLDRVEAEGDAALAVSEAEESAAVAEEVPLIDEIPDWLRDLDKVDVEEVPATAMFGDEDEVEEEAQEGAVPASLLALVAAGLLDESDLESAMAEMSDEDLESQREEDVPGWLSELVEEDEQAVAEAVPAAAEPILQELPTPVLEMPVKEEPPVVEP